MYSHHERWDGKGYPRGLAQEDDASGRPHLRRVDTFDSMTSDRPYRKALYNRGFDERDSQVQR